MTYEDRVEYLRDAEGDEAPGPLPPDAPGCFGPDGAPYTAADFLRSPLAPQMADDPRDARYPGRMSAFHDTPDEEIF